LFGILCHFILVPNKSSWFLKGTEYDTLLLTKNEKPNGVGTGVYGQRMISASFEQMTMILYQDRLKVTVVQVCMMDIAFEGDEPVFVSALQLSHVPLVVEI
jgi:hypothetical protein